MLRFWQESQRTFWTAAASQAGLRGRVRLSRRPTGRRSMQSRRPPALPKLTTAGPRCPILRPMHAATTSATAMSSAQAMDPDPHRVRGPPAGSLGPDAATRLLARVLRDRWFQTAEAEFIQHACAAKTFIAAQRGCASGRSCGLWSAMPARGSATAVAPAQRRAGQTTRSTMLSESSALDPDPDRGRPRNGTIWVDGQGDPLRATTRWTAARPRSVRS